MPKTESRPRERNRGKSDNKYPSWGGGRDSVRQADLFLQQETERRHKLTSRLIEGQDERMDRHVTPWLLLRYFEDPLGIAKDFGYRPIPSTQPFWISPDITIETSGLLGRPTATAGQVNYVHAQIRNLGAFTAAPVKVDFYWGDPSLGLSAAHMHKITEPGDPLGGSVYLEIESLHTADVRSQAWIPSMVNGGHECLIVNCSNWVADPIRHPFQPVQDRHVGQRNLQVTDAPPGGVIHFSLKLNNLFMERSRAVIASRVQHLRLTRPISHRADLRLAIRNAVQFLTERPVQLTAAARQENPRTLLKAMSSEKETAHREDLDFRMIRADYGASYIATELRERRRSFWIDQSVGSTQDVSSSSRRSQADYNSPTGALAVLREVALDGGEQREVQFEAGIPEQARPGDFLGYHIFQQSENGIAGGYTVVAVITG